MEYQVPQFIEVEDKIIGPLTLRQFIYIAGAGGLCVIFFAYFNFFFAVLFSLPVAGFGAALAFYKVNGKPFIEMLEAAFNYTAGAKLLIWKQATPVVKNETPVQPDATPTPIRNARLTRGKLSELAWSLDVRPGASITTRRTI